MDKNLIKKKIVEENMDLPPHEIKKILKKKYPAITNEQVEEIIISIRSPHKIYLEQEEKEEEER